MAMRKLLIIKAGTKLPALVDEPGDFEDWICAGMGVAPGNTVVSSVYREGFVLPGHDQLGGVVVTGSAAMVDDQDPWIRDTANWLRIAVERELPVLGICFGHQLLAHALSGQVMDNPNGIEVGTELARRVAADDALLTGIDLEIPVQTSHRQSVVQLPPGARRLARTARDPNHAFAYGRRAWGIQFHPEFNADITRAYVDYYRNDLLEAGRDADTMRAGCVETPVASAFLRRYAELVMEHP